VRLTKLGSAQLGYFKVLFGFGLFCELYDPTPFLGKKKKKVKWVGFGPRKETNPQKKKKKDRAESGWAVCPKLLPYSRLYVAMTASFQPWPIHSAIPQTP